MKEIVENNVYRFRKSVHISQEELAQRLGITRQTVIAIEKGNYTPSVLLAIKISHFFKKSIEDIFFLTYEK